MEYLRLVYELPAIVSGTTILAYLSPWKIASRFIPLLMFIVALVVLQVPEFISMALCLTIPGAWLQERILGISLDSHEPLKVTLPKLRKPNVTIKNFVTRAYPDPETDEEEAAQLPEEEPEPEPGDTVSTVQSFVPPL